MLKKMGAINKVDTVQIGKIWDIRQDDLPEGTPPKGMILINLRFGIEFALESGRRYKYFFSFAIVGNERDGYHLKEIRAQKSTSIAAFANAIGMKKDLFKDKITRPNDYVTLYREIGKKEIGLIIKDDQIRGFRPKNFSYTMPVID